MKNKKLNKIFNLVKRKYCCFCFILIAWICGSCSGNMSVDFKNISFGECITYYLTENSEEVDFNKEVLIRNNEEYNKFQQHCIELSKSDGRHQCNFPAVDFNSYDIIGKCTRTYGCDNVVSIRIDKDEKLKQIICEITVSSKKQCETTSLIMNYSMIPKIPNGYNLKFIVINN